MNSRNELRELKHIQNGSAHYYENEVDTKAGIIIYWPVPGQATALKFDYEKGAYVGLGDYDTFEMAETALRESYSSDGVKEGHIM